MDYWKEIADSWKKLGKLEMKFHELPIQAVEASLGGEEQQKLFEASPATARERIFQPVQLQPLLPQSWLVKGAVSKNSSLSIPRTWSEPGCSSLEENR